MGKEALNIHSATDAISGIMNRSQPPEPPKEEPKARQEVVSEPEEDADVEVQEEEEVSEASEEAEAEDVEVEAEEKPRKDAEDEDVDLEEDVTEIELEPFQLAKILGLKSEDDITVTNNGELYFKAKIDGKEREVSFDDLRDSYQLSRTHYERLHKLSDERKQFEESRQRTLQELQVQQQQMQAAIAQLEQDWSEDFKRVDWNRLREEDPTEYALKRSDYEDRKRKAGEYRQLLEGHQRQMMQEFAQHKQALQVEGAKRLKEVFDAPEYKHSPKWDDAEKQKLTLWLEKQGYTADQISNETNWQIIKWARDSMLREDELKTAKKQLKRVVRVPKIVKPGAPKSKPQLKKEEIDKFKARQKRSGGKMAETQDLISKILRG